MEFFGEVGHGPKTSRSDYKRYFVTNSSHKNPGNYGNNDEIQQWVTYGIITLC